MSSDSALSPVTGVHHCAHLQLNSPVLYLYDPGPTSSLNPSAMYTWWDPAVTEIHSKSKGQHTIGPTSALFLIPGLNHWAHSLCTGKPLSKNHFTSLYCHVHICGECSYNRTHWQSRPLQLPVHLQLTLILDASLTAITMCVSATNFCHYRAYCSQTL